MSVPTELLIADAINLVFLSLGGVFLLKFLLKFGSERSKGYAIYLAFGLIGYALFHEGAEVLHAIYNVEAGFAETAITSALALIYAFSAIRIRQELRKTFEMGGKKHGK